MAKQKKLYFVTTNEHKVREIAVVLAGFGVKLLQKKIELLEPGLETVEEVALAKAEHAFRLLRRPLIVEDTGIFFDAYRNFPGVFSKRVWLGIGFDGLMRLLRGKNRGAKFKVAIAYIDKPGKPKLFVGTLHGKILKKVKKISAQRLPYEKIFVPDGHKKTIVEMTLPEKNHISHRGKAARKLGKWLQHKRF